MLAFAFAPHEAIAQLDTLAASARLPAREADRCARLADTLRRPARVCLLGPSRGDIAQVVQAILGSTHLPRAAQPPAMELKYGTVPKSVATLEDGTTLAESGWPSADTVKREPVFLQMELPVENLRSMSFLVLALEPDPAMHKPALSWAARRSEIAIWCTRSFSVADARIWGHAPERLTQHAYLLETRRDVSIPRHGAVANFTETFFTAGHEAGTTLDIEPLITRLTSDIEDARNADLDMAQLFLHRLRHLAVETPDDAPGEGRTDTNQTSVKHKLDLRPILSEPFLFLMARARDLVDVLAAVDPSQEWPGTVLDECIDIVEGLRDRAENWPDDIAPIRALQAMIEEVCDTTTLLRIEAGAEQAQDAAAMLFQLRVAFEQTLGWGTD